MLSHLNIPLHIFYGTVDSQLKQSIEDPKLSKFLLFFL